MFKFIRYPIAFSLVTGLALVASLSIAASLLTLWMTDVMSGDAAAVNLAGSLRMQSYRIAFAIESDTSSEETSALLTEFESRLLSKELKGQIPDFEVELKQNFDHVANRFDQMKHFAMDQPQTYLTNVESFVADIDEMVALIEAWSEGKVKKLRQRQMLIAAISLIAAAMFALIIAYRVVIPLQSLMKAVVEIGRGNRQARVYDNHADEFGELSNTFNLMAQEIDEVHLSLESKIADQTKELSRNNRTLEFLFNLSQQLSTENPETDLLKESAANDLKSICNNSNIFWTDKDTLNSDQCYAVKCLTDRSHLVCEYEFPMEDWQKKIFKTVVDLFDNALNRINAHNNENRIALLNERSSIARELHDSLAQQLSYLKIQVVRWIKLKEREADADTLDGIIQELRDGLNSSYRKLRELLVTFRSHSDEPGLIPSVKAAADEINRISQQTMVHLYIDPQWPTNLLPSHEIHCLHVIREALTNVVKHAQAENAVVSLKVKEGLLEIRINDDGIGFSEDPHKPMHYGLKIMSERAQRINGQIQYETLKLGGAGVKLTFKPEQSEEETHD